MLSTGIELEKLVIAKDCFDEWLILEASEEFTKMLDGPYCEDNGFEFSTLPTDAGIYDVDCAVFWDDGINYFNEHTDPDWRIEILSCKKLL